VKWRHFRVTFARARSRDIISCHVTATTCKLQPCKSTNVPKPSFRPFQPLPGDFWWNFTSGLLPVKPGYITSFPVPWLPPPASYRPAGAQMHTKPVFGLLQPLPGDFRWNNITTESLLVVLGHVTSFPVTSLPPPASYSPVGSQTYTNPELSAIYSHLKVTSSEITSLPVATGHVTSFPVTWLPPRASYSSVGAQTYTKHEFSAFYSHLQMTSGEMTSLPGHFRSSLVTWCHFLSRDCNHLRVTAL